MNCKYNGFLPKDFIKISKPYDQTLFFGTKKTDKQSVLNKTRYFNTNFLDNTKISLTFVALFEYSVRWEIKKLIILILSNTKKIKTMKTFQLEGTPRTDLGKKAVKALRKQNLIPAVLNGGQLVTLPYDNALKAGEKVVEIANNQALIVTDFTVSTESVRKLVYTPEIFAIDLTIGDKKTKAVIKDIQFHPVTDAILHMDFLEVNEQKPIIMEVPVALEGHSEGVKAGGKLSLEMRKLKVKAIYSQIPEKLVINIDNLGLGKTIQVGELHFEGLELMNAKNAVVCAVKLTRAARGLQAKSGK